jgi:hypothetical protein
VQGIGGLNPPSQIFFVATGQRNRESAFQQPMLIQVLIQGFL